MSIKEKKNKEKEGEWKNKINLSLRGQYMTRKCFCGIWNDIHICMIIMI